MATQHSRGEGESPSSQGPGQLSAEGPGELSEASPSEEALLREVAQAPAARPAALDADLEAGALRGLPRFTAARSLGRGGFGTVFEAYDSLRGAPVAIKILHRCDPRALYLFKQEFRALSELSHPGLVRLYELFADGDRWFFTMELVPGTTLLAHVRREAERGAGASSDSARLAPTLELRATPKGDGDGAGGAVPASPPAPPLRQVGPLCDALIGLCEALEALHAAGKVHRDIKPHNVLCTPEGRVVLLDFGLLGEVAQDSASLSEISGTPDYMAPEQAAGRPPSPASDLYSVGVLLYEALTGTRPFSGPALKVLADKQVREGPAPSAALPPGSVPEELDRLCVALLRRDPAARPSAAALRAALLLLRGRLPPSPSPRPAGGPGGGPLIGRQAQLQALTAAYEDSAGGPVVALCHGASGVGKSTLCRHFLRLLRERDAQAVLLSGRCFENEQIPYKALDGVIDALSRHLRHLPEERALPLLPRDVAALARLFPVLRQVPAVCAAPERRIADPQRQQRAAFLALRELLCRLSDRGRVVLHIDDLQWGDLDSIALLLEVLSPPEAPALLVCVTYRSEEAESSPVISALRRMLREAGPGLSVREIPVGELSEEGALCLARVLSPAGDGELQARLAAESGGNPFFLVALSRLAGAPGGSRVTVEEVVREQVARMPKAARQMLALVCVAGQPIERGVVSGALASGPEGGGMTEPEALSLLRAERLLRVRAGARQELLPYHDRIRETVVAQLGAEQRRGCHLRLAEELQRAQAEPERLLHHLQAAGERARAARCALAAADRAMGALAFAQAARLYEEALRSEVLDRDEVRQALPRAADAHAAAGRLRDAAQAYLLAAREAQGEGALLLRRRAMEQLLLGRDLKGGLAVAAELLPPMGLPVPPGGLRALLGLLLLRLWLWLRGPLRRTRPAAQVPPEDLLRLDTHAPLASALGLLDPLRGAYAETQHLLLALRVGEPQRLARVLGLEAYLQAMGGRMGAAEAILGRARALLAPEGDSDGALSARALLDVAEASIALEQGRFRLGAARADEVAAFLDERGVGLAWVADLARTSALLCRLWLGDLGALSARLPALVADAQDRGSLLLLRVARHVAGHVCLGRDDVQGAEEALRRLRLEAEGEGDVRDRLTILSSEVTLALYRGDGASAWASVAATWPRLRRGGLLGAGTQRVVARSLRGTAALAAFDGRREAALLRVARCEGRRLRGERSPWARALGLLLVAGVARRRGQGDAARMLQAAEEGLASAEIALHAAAARLRRGAWIGGAEGRRLIAEAEGALSAQGVSAPARLAAMLVP